VKDPSIINLAEYRREAMSDTFDFYWRVLRNSQELEAVMVVKGGTSYAGVGWRPLSLTAACKGFPFLEDMPENLSSVTNVTETDFEPQAEPEPSSASTELQNGEEVEETAAPTSQDDTASAEPEPSSEPTLLSSTTTETIHHHEKY